MSLTNTPSADRLHIILLGKRNSGKSSLINAITGQQVALVSDHPGTTTDPVYKAMEIHGIGPCMWMDTAGFDDQGELGLMRVERTQKALEKADIALLLVDGPDLSQEKQWMDALKQRKIPVILILNKGDLRSDPEQELEQAEKILGKKPMVVSAKTGQGVEEIRKALIAALPEDFDAHSITGHLVQKGDSVLLVMPQDIQAPKGRLILPQVQTIRDLLDHGCIVTSCTADGLEGALAALAKPPKLIITDSQVFGKVYEKKPEESLLTSFSVLFAEYKGDIAAFVEGAQAIDGLTENSHVLIAEACTHAPLEEDIGRVKIPRMLRKKVGQGLSITMVAGSDFPKDLSRYDLVIHCGACMFNRKHVLSRVEQAKAQQVPMTNYGVAIAKLTGILEHITY